METIVFNQVNINSEVRELCYLLCKKHIKEEVNYNIEFISKPVKYLGRCCYKGRENKYTLKFPILAFNLWFKEGNMEQIEDTILHEIAHVLCREMHGNRHGHDSYWRFIARSIGCSGERCASSNIRQYKYVYECPKCGKKFYRLRKYSDSRSCASCNKKYNNGKYSKDHEIILIESYKQAQVMYKEAI